MPFAALIPLIAGVLGAGATTLASSQNRRNTKDQTDLIDEENREDRAHEIEMMKLQAALQDDEQEAQQKQFILIGAGIVGFVLLIIVVMIIKKLIE